jgi:hypothetical protein
VEGSYHHALTSAVVRRVRAQHGVRLVTAIFDQTGELLDVSEQDRVGGLET